MGLQAPIKVYKSYPRSLIFIDYSFDSGQSKTKAWWSELASALWFLLALWRYVIYYGNLLAILILMVRAGRS